MIFKKKHQKSSVKEIKYMEGLKACKSEWLNNNTIQRTVMTHCLAGLYIFTKKSLDIQNVILSTENLWRFRNEQILNPLGK